MKHIYSITFFLFTFFINAQEVKVDSILINKINFYVNSEFGYEAEIPKWLTIRTNGASNLWGGTIDAVNGIENEIIINSYSKKEFKSIKNFINEKADKYKTGDKINAQTVLLKQDLDNFENVGKAYKFQLVNGNKIYHSLFLFAESEKGYLWIIFTATPETFNINLEKFKLFLKNLKINI
jgi:hypothetical protein